MPKILVILRKHWILLTSEKEMPFHSIEFENWCCHCVLGDLLDMLNYLSAEARFRVCNEQFTIFICLWTRKKETAAEKRLKE